MKHRVLHIIYSLFRGGAERLLETTVKYSSGSCFQHNVCVLTRGGDLRKVLEEAGARTYLLGKKSRLDPAFMTRLTRLVGSGEFDLLHLHSVSANVWTTMAAFLSRTATPVVRTEHWPFFRGRFPFGYEHIYSLLSARSKKIICVSDQARASFAQRYPSLKEKLITILNGVPVEEFASLPPQDECRAEFGLPLKVPMAGAVGRVAKEKNHQSLIEAFSLLAEKGHPAHLAILGNGPLKEPLMARAVKLGIAERVHFLPVTSQVNIFYGAVNLFVLSSDIEGMPLTLLEAMAAGLPAVATRAGGIPEAVESGKTGYTVDTGSPSSLALRIGEILSDPVKAARMGEAGRNSARGRFTAGRYIAEHEKLYREVISEAGGGGRG